MDWKGCGRKRTSSNLRHHSGFFPEGLIRTIHAWCSTEVPKIYLSNTRQKRYRIRQLAGSLKQRGILWEAVEVVAFFFFFWQSTRTWRWQKQSSSISTGPELTWAERHDGGNGFSIRWGKGLARQFSISLKSERQRGRTWLNTVERVSGDAAQPENSLINFRLRLLLLIALECLRFANIWNILIFRSLHPFENTILVLLNAFNELSPSQRRTS